MTYVIQSVRNLKLRVESKAEQFAGIHPRLSCICAVVVMPIACLLSVFAVTAAVMLPISLLCGWL